MESIKKLNGAAEEKARIANEHKENLQKNENFNKLKTNGRSSFTTNIKIYYFIIGIVIGSS